MKKKIMSKFLVMGLFLGLLASPLQPLKFLPNQSALIVHAADANTLPQDTKDGVILHAFDWSFNTIKNNLPQIAAAGYKSIQVSPVQGTKSSSTDPAQWWLLYQPTNQSVGNAQLGTLADFTSLCSTAKTYGISIIVDVVMNHMANNGNKDQLDSTVDPAFRDSSLYHNLGQCSNWSNRYDITQRGIGMPDLNTQNSTVQSKALAFLNQCVDAGASGFRFDAAKHIETNVGLDAGQTWAGNYWNYVLGSSLHNRANLYIYGEILQDGTVDNISSYANFMNVTASTYGYNLRTAITSNNLNSAQGMGGLNPAQSVGFVETHDTYEDGTSSNLTAWQRKMGWAIVAARAGVTPLFLARPTGSIGTAGDTQWKDSDIIAVNKFHNAMVNQNEYLRLTNNNQTMLIDRGTVGTVVVNAAGSFNISSPTNLANGTYTNHGSASCTLSVSNGTITGTVPGNSVVVLYNSTPDPDPQPTTAVSWTPTTPVAGTSVTITYNATGRVLQGASSVKMHWGYDGWKSPVDTTMTASGTNVWKTTVTVPSAATSTLDLCFTNGSIWDNNNQQDWSIKVTPNGGGTTTYAPHTGYKVDYDSSALVQGKSFTVFYNGSLASSSTVKLHWGVNGWTGLTDTTMTKRSDGFWQATITIPTTATKLDFDFTNGSSWDNNGSQDWHLQVWSASVPVQVSPAPVASKTVTVYYKGTLASAATSMTLHWGYNNFTSPKDVVMTKQSDGRWTATITIPAGSYSLNMSFKNNAGTWDSNNSANYNYSCAQ